MAHDLYGREIKLNDTVLVFNIIRTATPKIDRIISKVVDIKDNGLLVLSILKLNNGRNLEVKSEEAILMASEGLDLIIERVEKKVVEQVASIKARRMGSL